MQAKLPYGAAQWVGSSKLSLSGAKRLQAEAAAEGLN